MIVTEKHLRFSVELVHSLVLHHYRQKVHQLDGGLLLGIHLGMFDRHQFVTDVFLDLQSHLNLEHVLDHHVVLGLDELVDVVSGDEEIGVIGNSHFELEVLGEFGDQPGVVHEMTSILEVGVHDHRKEVVLKHHFVEAGLKELLQSLLGLALFTHHLHRFLPLELHGFGRLRILT